MINHSFERKFYRAYFTLCKNIVRGFSRARHAHKVLKWDFYYDAIYESLRKLYHSMHYPFFHYCRIFKTIQQFCHKILAREIFTCTLIYNNPPLSQPMNIVQISLKFPFFNKNVIYPLR